VRAIRGATTVDTDHADAVVQATAELLTALAHENQLSAESMISAVFTVTPDITSAFPATAARQLGWTDLALMCATEIPVPGALSHCIRVLIHAELDAGVPPRHVYLRRATTLRPDLRYE
jgi:chorismate mutase